MKKFFEQSWLALVSSLVFGLLVAFVNGQLKPLIEKNAEAKLSRSIAAVFLQKGDAAPSELTVESVAVSPPTPSGITSYYKVSDKNGRVAGYAFRGQGVGFANKISLLIALSPEKDLLLGIEVLEANETPGFGDKMKEPLFKDQFSGGKPVPRAKQKWVVVKRKTQSDNEIQAITGSTITSEAVVSIVNKAIIEMADIIK